MSDPSGTFEPDGVVVPAVNTEPEATIDLLNAVASTDERATAADMPALTVFDRCDAPDCTSQAYIRARFPSGLELVFCGHHGRELTPALAGRGAVIRDDSSLLTADRRLDSGS
jgi:hypothetical protein